MQNQNTMSSFSYEKITEEVPGMTKPTLFKSNDFVWAFQEIIDTYGTPTYKEVNPTLFTIVSFPFLFGVMFGDIMHGALLFTFSSWLCFADKSRPGTLANSLAPVRYLFLLMGLFSFYNGVIYNDFSSLSTNMFGKTCFDKLEEIDGVEYAKKSDQSCVYPFGMDPIWYRSVQEIQYMNSFKMKTSVIFGVWQMAFGTIMKGYNALYFKRYSELVFEVTTQFLLLMALFGFMDLLIIEKWLTNYDDLPEGQMPPAIITTMIVMFINKGERPADNIEVDIISNQKETMQMLLGVAALCAPIMLLAKPILMHLQSKKSEDDDYIRVQGKQQ